MINAIQDEAGQRAILELLQLLSEFEYVIKFLGELKGEESPIELLKGLSEQPEQIQVEFLRWVSNENIEGIVAFIHLRMLIV